MSRRPPKAAVEQPEGAAEEQEGRECPPRHLSGEVRTAVEHDEQRGKGDGGEGGERGDVPVAHAQGRGRGVA